MRGVKKLLTGGTSADGSPELSYRPLMVAAKYGYVKIMKLLVEKGANVEARTTGDGRDIYGRSNTIKDGTQALHAAAFCGKVGALNVLLQAGADPNAVDSEGFTTLMAVCSEQGVASTRLVMVQALLKAGAIPAISSYCGMTAMHMAASTGATEVIDLLLSAPTTLNHVTIGNVTPLCTAAQHGQEGAVAHLLALGATDEWVTQNGNICALTAAVQQNQVGVVRILLGSAKAIKAAGGLVPEAIGLAVSRRGRASAKILQMLLAVEGEERQRHWLGLSVGDRPLLHAAAAFNSLEGTHVLLAAGADEAEASAHGRCASDLVGSACPIYNRDNDLEAAVCRMLRRGPAFRARTWAWSPLATGAPPRPPPPGGGEVLSTTSGRSPPIGPLGVRLFRPMDRRFFARRFAR